MLTGCKQAIIVTEGWYDAALLRALLGEQYSVESMKEARDVYERFWECIADRMQEPARQSRPCVIVYIAGGASRVGERAASVLQAFKALRKITPPDDTCIVALLDSDQDTPDSVVKRHAETLLRGAKATHATKLFAAACTEASRPRACIASWRCSAECWIAILAPGQPPVDIEECSSETRRRCHREASKLLKGCGEETAPWELQRLMEEAIEPWRSMLLSLASQLRDGGGVD